MVTETRLRTLSPEEQLEDKLHCGFNKALGMNEQEYRRDFAHIMIQANILREKMSEKRDGAVIVVEPRVRFEKIVTMQNLDVNPAVFYIPRCYPKSQPYAVWTEVFPSSCSLPESYRQISPLEGIQVNQESNLTNFPILALPGGIYERLPYALNKHRVRVLVLENYLGKYRLSQVYRHEINSLVGVLGCWKGNDNEI